jgi:hypothetical protein
MRDPRKDRNQCDTLLVEFHRYDDGCVILSGTIKDRYHSFDIYEKYPTGTPVAKVLRVLAAFIKGWEAGHLTGADLWDQLQLPFEGTRWR